MITRVNVPLLQRCTADLSRFAIQSLMCHVIHSAMIGSSNVSLGIKQTCPHRLCCNSDTPKLVCTCHGICWRKVAYGSSVATKIRHMMHPSFMYTQYLGNCYTCPSRNHLMLVEQTKISQHSHTPEGSLLCSMLAQFLASKVLRTRRG